MAKQTSNPRIVTKKHIARLERERQQITLIRAIAISGIVIVALLLGYGYLKLNILTLREPVAEVNGVKITTGDFQERVRMQRVSLYNELNRYVFFEQNFGMDTSQQQQQVYMQLGSTDAMGDQVLNLMIDEVLIRQEAEKRGITVSEEEVEKLFHESYGFFPDGTATPTVTPTEFSLPTLNAEQLLLYPATATATEALTSTPAPTSTPDRSVTPTATATTAPATPSPVPLPATATSTPYTLEGFQGQYNDTIKQFKDYGISEKTLRQVYEVDILRNKLKDELAKDLPHTETQVLVRHILVADPALAVSLSQRLKNGQDFATLAADYSTDPGSAANGGFYEWAPASNYVPEFRDATLNQPIGEIGDPVKTEFGYHVIQVIAREELPITDAQFEQKKQTNFDEWLTKTREEAEKTTYEIWRERVPSEPVLQ